MRVINKKYRKLVLVCTNVKDNGRECCGAKGSADLHLKIKEAMSAADPLIRVSRTGCLGNCETGVTVVIMPDNLWFGGANMNDVDEIVRLAVGKGEVAASKDSDGDFLGM